MNIGTFAVILCMRQKDVMVERIEDLKGLSKTQPGMAMAMAIFMFSMAGIPPLVGFFGKFRSEEHTSELQSLMRLSYAVFCLKNKKYMTEQKQPPDPASHLSTSITTQ